ncbi:hypothetical protein PYW07_003469 [Mythimna separata]|uniref:Carboxylesterase type B domain-containing protein n=1 Tax=Mythimna separata TaxID=271217 RepID=A0AAD7YI62_MYTSE|nr:hypothetical protein PYW07_003469 [Mythimna separata]
MRLIGSFAVLLLFTIHNIACDDDTLVQTTKGPIRGEKLKTVVAGTQYYSYKGIPYARPPIGKLRFKAPKEAAQWEAVLNCTAHGSVCPQFNPITAVYTSGSEDCLFLNVYSPNIKSASLYPVIVFIHGGANIFGSGNSDLYGPDYFIEKNVVVVTINYRLGALGFLSIGSNDVPGNAALKDQALALKWVNKNIKKFKGDPNSVTLVGDTAGGQAVTLHMLSPMSKGLFQRGIAMSGSPTCDYGLTYNPPRKAQIFGKLLNCTNVENESALLTCLQNAPYDAFYSLAPTVLASEPIIDVLFKLEHFTPVIEKTTENNFITEEYYDILKSGRVNNEVDFMIGYGGKEAVLLIDLYYAQYIADYDRYRELFSPSELLTKCTPDINMEVADRVVKYYFGDKKVTVDNLDLFLNYASNTSIAYHAQRFANKWAPLGQKTYFFKFESFTSWNFFGQFGTKYGIKEAAHFDFGYYLFYPNSLNWSVDTNSLEYKLSQQIVTAVVNFAKSGNPSVDNIVWPTYSPSNKAYVSFTNDGLKVGNGPDEADYQLWKSIFEYAEIPF